MYLGKSLGDELFDGLGGSVLGFVLDDGSVRLDNIDGWERFSVQVGRNEFTLFISTELVDIKIRSIGEFAKVVFHLLAELAPRSVDSNDGSLSRLGNLQSGIGGFNVLDGTFFPQVTVPGLFGTINVDSWLLAIIIERRQMEIFNCEQFVPNSKEIENTTKIKTRLKFYTTYHTRSWYFRRRWQVRRNVPYAQRRSRAIGSCHPRI